MNKQLLSLGLVLWAHAAWAQQADSRIQRDLRTIDVWSQRNSVIKKDSLPPSLKLRQRTLEIPQNIISVSGALLQQQGGLELKDAARNASGVYFGYNSSPFDHSASIQIRGFAAYSLINGMPRHANYGAVLDDQALFESIDFIKGPAGFVNSLGEASGTININTKTPGSRLLNIEATGGSFGLARVAVDAGSNVKAKGFSYRFNAAYQHQDSYLDLLQTNKYVVAPVLQYNFSERTFIQGEYDYIRGESLNGSDITKLRPENEALHDRIGINLNAAAGLPKTFYQAQTMRLLFSHRFNDNWRIISQSQYTLAPYKTWSLLSSETYTGVSFDDQGQTVRVASNTANGGRTFASQVYVNGRFNTGSIVHDIIIGGDITSSRDSLRTGFGLYTFPLYRDKLNYGVAADSVAILNPAMGSAFKNNLTYETAYFYDHIRLARKWLLAVGLRYTWYNNKTIQQASPALKPKENLYSQNALSPRAALTFLVDSSTSLYALYDQSFLPQSGLKAGSQVDPATGNPVGEPVDPQRNNDMELGIKKQWFGNRLLTTINGFHTVKRNVLMKDIRYVALNYKRQIGEYSSDGIEADVLGNIGNRITVTANYTFVDARITKDTANSPLIGNKLPGTPQQLINTWAQYSLPLGSGRVLAFSVGQNTQLKRSTYSKDTYLPDFTRWDAGISYNTSRYYFRINADNLTNKRYIESGDIGFDYPMSGANYFFVEGAPFSIKCTVGIKLL